jgi:hypothetical protein
MTVKEQLLQELTSAPVRKASEKPNRLIVETLNFLRFLKTKERFPEADTPRTSLTSAAETMHDFYVEGSELTEFIDCADEDFYEYENYA